MQLGMRVVRGPDWEWKNQDGGEGSAGTVVKLGQQDEKSPSRPQLVWVQWDCGTKASYRAGIDGKHDLRVLDNANVGELIFLILRLFALIYHTCMHSRDTIFNLMDAGSYACMLSRKRSKFKDKAHRK